MFHKYIQDINEFPALGTTPSKPSDTRRSTNKPTYASTTANEIRNSAVFGNHGPNTSQRNPSSSNNNKKLGFSSPPALEKKEASSQKPEEFNSQFSDVENEHLLQSGRSTADLNSNQSLPQTDDQDSYGLVGLLGVLRMISADQSMLALGSDLSTLGLNLNPSSNSTLYSTFVSLWGDSQNIPHHEMIIQPSFYCPSYYSQVSDSPSAFKRMDAFSDEILFYTFYSMPKEIDQYVAAKELRKRNWRYCKELGIWITREKGSGEHEPFDRPRSGQSSEFGVFTFFDPALWKKVKREWIIKWDMMEEGELDENDTVEIL